MGIDSIFAHITKDYTIDLVDTSSKSLSVISEKPFYVGPTFNEYNNDNSSPIVVFSAPGASGKSALGRYLSYKYNSLYWNLADIRLGENSFFGTMMQAVGSSKYSKLISAIKDYKTLLVIDAFDEAELISGWNMIEELLQNITSEFFGNKKPCIALLSRTETAEHIVAFLKENNIGYQHYEIRYFTEPQAKDFIISYIKEKGKPVTTAITDTINQYFIKITDVFRQEDTDPTNFIGYAPVLQAIALSIISQSNTISLLNSITSTKNMIIVTQILYNLLIREHEKFTNALKSSISEKLLPAIQDNSIYIYTELEQMIRIMFYMEEQKCIYDDFEITSLPPEIVSDYNDKLDVFIPQHPFLFSLYENKNIDFAGPAFRDYALATIMNDDSYADFAIEHIKNTLIDTHFPSLLFWDFYISKSSNKVSLQHIPFLFQSFKAKNRINEDSKLSIVIDDEQAYATFTSYNITTGEELECTELEIIKNDSNIIEFNIIKNVTIDAPITLIVKGKGNSISLTDFCINCSIIEIHGNTCEFISNNCPCYLFSKENLIFDAGIRINVYSKSDDNIKVAFPNIKNVYSLTKYYFDETSTNNDYDSFRYHIERIFSYFRQHGKDTLAKDAEKIDFHVLSNTLRKSIFDFLLSDGIVYKEEHLYKINKEKMKNIGISWVKDDTKLQGLYSKYLNYPK